MTIDLGEPREIGRVDLMIYDDGGGVRAPKSYRIQTWDGSAWRDVEKPILDPAKPAGGVMNIATFDSERTNRVRVVFTHCDGARSGVTELELRKR